MHYDMVLRLFNHCAWMIQFSSILQFLLSLRRLRPKAAVPFEMGFCFSYTSSRERFSVVGTYAC